MNTYTYLNVHHTKKRTQLNDRNQLIIKNVSNPLQLEFKENKDSI